MGGAAILIGLKIDLLAIDGDPRPARSIGEMWTTIVRPAASKILGAVENDPAGRCRSERNHRITDFSAGIDTDLDATQTVAVDQESAVRADFALADLSSAYADIRIIISHSRYVDGRTGKFEVGWAKT